ncbi:hypothetical protein Ae505Ps2_4390 [Pseudonocardia sp. Ae505_Ps2]|nr:hypothetical protein Ae505Ps2_4390 [Pseudonocardia sp. Ae505_Ps2]
MNTTWRPANAQVAISGETVAESVTISALAR